MREQRFCVQNRDKTIKQIIEEEASAGDVFYTEITGNCRNIKVTKARWRAMYRARKELGAPYTMIGKIFNKDHTTVINAVKKIQMHNPDGNLKVIPCYSVSTKNENYV